MNPISLGRQSQDDPLERLLRGVHENFATPCAASFSAFLQTEIGMQLEAVRFQNATDFRNSLETPSAVISFELTPLGERAILALDCPAVFGLLELLLGGDPGEDQSSAGQVERRNFTEIEWALLEELVRVLVAPLGQAWKPFHAVEFKVLALENDPQLLTLPEPSQPLVRLDFALQLARQTGHIRIAVPRAFFDPDAGQEAGAGQAGVEPWRRNLELLGEAKVELEVLLEGPAMQLRQLAALETGQVVCFDYSLQKPLRAVVNETIPISGQIVNAGRKRAFRIDALP
jgi:flagellar motor switch protein FliM